VTEGSIRQGDRDPDGDRRNREGRRGAVRSLKRVALWTTSAIVVVFMFSVFSWLGLAAAATVAVWRVFSWPARWIAFPAVVSMPAVGLLAGTFGEEVADDLAIAIFFALFSAGVVGALGSLSSSSRPTERSENSSVAMTWGSGSRLRSFLSRRGDYVVVTGAALLAAQTWFRPGTYIAFGDLFPFLEDSALLSKAIPVWNTLSNGVGGRNSSIVNAPVALLETSVDALGGSGPLFERLFITGLFVAQGLTIAFLIRSVWPRCRMVARAAGALFYLFNLLAFFNLPGSVQMLAFVTLPLLSALMIRGLQTGRPKYAYLWGLASSALGYVAANLPLLGTTVLGSISLALLAHFSRRGRVETLTSFALRAIPLFVLLNCWWIVPATITLLGTPNLASIPTSPQDWGWTHARNSFTNLFSLNVAWGWPQPIYYPYAHNYLNPLMSVFVYAPAALAFGSLTFQKTNRTIQAMVSVLSLWALVLLFIAKGIHPPFASANEKLLTEVPGMWVLREPASKLLPIVTVIFSLLIAYCVDKALDTLEARRGSRRHWWVDPATPVVAIGLSLSLVAWPIATGDIVADERPLLPGPHIKIPTYWRDVASELNERQGDAGTVMLLPLSDFYQMPYEWGFYGSDVLASHLFERPVIVGAGIGYIPPPPEVQAAITRLETAMQADDRSTVAWSLRALGVRYVLVRGDIDYDVALRLGRRIEPSTSYSEILSRERLFHLVGRFGALSLYESKATAPAPVTAWSRTHVMDSFAFTPTVGPQLTDSAMITASQAEWIQAVDGPHPRLDVEEVDEARYLISVKDARAPFVLTLNQTFDPGWNARDPSIEASHAVTNGFANGWLVDRIGSFDIEIAFEPEKFARSARIVSLVSLTLMGVGSAAWRLRYRFAR
jgi:hypothetical protein